jgi:Tfp pilus assembly protein PilF
MADESSAGMKAVQTWNPLHVVVMSAVCLAIGFLAGYLLRGSAPGSAQPATPSTMAVASDSSATPATSDSPPPSPHKQVTLDDLKRMADKKAAPLLEKLKSTPKDAKLLNEIALLYESAHQFKEAEGYFEKSLQYDPKNVSVRADYASCLYYTGDVDGALAQLNKSLTYDPKHAGTLLNIGIIRWRGKNDAAGAVAVWERLLKYHPDFPQKDQVEHMIAQVKLKAKTASAPKENL